MPPFKMLGTTPDMLESDVFLSLVGAIPELMLKLGALNLRQLRQVKVFAPVDGLGSEFRLGLPANELACVDDVSNVRASLVCEMFGLMRMEPRTNEALQAVAWALLDLILHHYERHGQNRINTDLESVEIYWLVRPEEDGTGWVSWQNPETLNEGELSAEIAKTEAVLGLIRLAGERARVAGRTHEVSVWESIEANFELRLRDLVYRLPEPG
jgi:hypothetical protein